MNSLLVLAILTIHCVHALAVGDMKSSGSTTAKEKVRMNRRGVLAWDNYQDDEWQQEPLKYRVSRLHVRAQQDDTAVVYCKALRKAFLWIQDHKLPVWPGCFLDLALTQYLDHLCYGSRKGLSEGKYAVSGCAAVFPSAHLRLTGR